MIEIAYVNGTTSVNIPMYQMHLEGTFSPDGADMGGAWIGGLVDTRNLGPLLDIGVGDDVVCEYLTVFGVTCEDCGEGDDFCLYIEAHFDDASVVEGMVIDPDPLGEGG